MHHRATMNLDLSGKSDTTIRELGFGGRSTHPFFPQKMKAANRLKRAFKGSVSIPNFSPRDSLLGDLNSLTRRKTLRGEVFVSHQDLMQQTQFIKG